jgi:hypothetical protein
MARQCFLMLLLIAMISCSDDDHESLTADDLETEIIEMNWCSTVKDLYVPEVFDLESSLVKPGVNQARGARHTLRFQ